ncbi:MAG: insulinase family protein [Raineya sp.]|nr:insulinase family protein [Raineya sp.]
MVRKPICILMLLWGALATQIAFSQGTQSIPLNPKVKVGKLANGLTYYIQQNGKPEKRVELRLAVNAGSVLETEKQLGLAHFVEHMLFNGTKKFPKNEIVSYLQSIGVQFGGDLNAYTSFDETVYILPVPTDKPELVDKGLEILREWASEATFDPAEIDKERGVVLEEWRLGRGAEQRMQDKQFPIILKGSQYAKRLPIGTEKVLRNFKHKEAINFYRDWYRPNLMAVIAVGDIDVNAMEEKIKKLFSELKNPAKEKPRTTFPVPDHKETLITIASDKEAAFPSVGIIYKKNPREIKTEQDYFEKLKMDVFSGMLNERFDEIRLSANPPFSFAGAYYGDYVRTKDAFSLNANTDEKNLLNALRVLLTEAKRLEKHGFVQQELDLYKKKYMANLEKRYNDRDKTESGTIVWSYVSHFLEGKPAPGIEYDYDFAKKYLDKIKLEDLNGIIKNLISKENCVIAIQSPEKEGFKIPTENDVKAILAEVEQADVKPYEAKKIAQSLSEGIKITPGKIVSEKKLEKIGVTELTLSNGAKVILKPTDFKNDEIIISAFSNGGTSLASDQDVHSANYIAGVIAESGINNLSQTDMKKVMAGKNVRINPYINDLQEGLNGSTTPKDLETALELIHLYFVAPRQDEEAFKSKMQRDKAFLGNLLSNPQFYFFSELSKILSNNHPRTIGFIPEFDKINYQKGFSFYKDRFADASDFTFILVGAFKVEEIKPLLEKYLASLPNTGRKENWKDNGVRPPKGMLDKTIFKGSDPKSFVQIVFAGDDNSPYDFKNSFALTTLSDLLDIKLVEKIREESSGAYTVGSSGNLSKYPRTSYFFNISFPCDPKRVDELTKQALEEVEKIQKGNIDEKDLEKVKEQRKRQMEVDIKTNRYWANTLQNYYFNGNNPEMIADWESRLAWITKDLMQNTAKKYLNTKEYIRVVLKPEEKK